MMNENIENSPAAESIIAAANGGDSARRTIASKKIGAAFFVLGAVEILLILCSAVLTFFIVPASIFVSRNSDEAFSWFLVGVVSIFNLALGLLLMPLAFVVGKSFRSEKKWSRAVGISAAIVALLQIPGGVLFGVYLLWKIFNLNRTEKEK